MGKGARVGHSWDSSALPVGCPQSQRGCLVPVLTLPLKEQGPRAFKSHRLFIGDLNVSEEEEEGEEDTDGDEEGENEEEEEDDVEAGSEKEEEARLTALEEQRMEEKVLES